MQVSGNIPVSFDVLAGLSTRLRSEQTFEQFNSDGVEIRLKS
jgi:hypothetical protein